MSLEPGVACDNRWVRIHDDSGNKLDAVYVALTDVEAKQLISYLQDLLATREKGWHEHLIEEEMVSEREGRIVNELTVYRADDDSMVF
jgi:hypothetical protein